MTPNDAQPIVHGSPRIERKLQDTLLAEIVEATLGGEAQRVLNLEVEGGGE